MLGCSINVLVFCCFLKLICFADKDYRYRVEYVPVSHVCYVSLCLEIAALTQMLIMKKCVHELNPNHI